MKKISILLLVVVYFSSCKKFQKGVNEVAGDSGTQYVCIVEEPRPGQTDGVLFHYASSTFYYWPDKSCSDLGYTKKSGDDQYQNPNGMDLPGENGYWADGGINGGGGGNGGGGNPSFCASGYNEPTSDGQLSAFCESAFYYRCNGYSLSSQEVSYSCEQYSNLQSLGGNFPDCQYCQ
jgi:hypothetical protein